MIPLLSILTTVLFYGVLFGVLARVLGKRRRPGSYESRRDFSELFKESDDHNPDHDDHVEYQLRYSSKNMSKEERFLAQKEARELAKIKDKPLSEAERNVLYGG